MTAPLDGDARFATALPAALLLVGAVRDRDADTVAEALAGADLPAVCVALAAMVDDNHGVRDLLAWTAYDIRLTPTCDPALDRSPTGTRAVHGTRSRYVAGCRGSACRQAESAYQHQRYARDKASAVAGAA